MIQKKTLMQMLLFYAQCTERHQLAIVNPERANYLTYEEDINSWISIASGSSGMRIIKGKLRFGVQYLASRGEALGFGLKPAVVLEYSEHWPWDYCYLYKL